jgi:hypothetical protein
LIIGAGGGDTYELTFDTANGPIQSLDGHMTFNLFDFVVLEL